MGVRLSDLPASVQAKLRAEGKVPKRGRTMNRTEAKFFGWFRSLYPNVWIAYEPITLKLAHDCRYTPDFFAVYPRSDILEDGPTVYEVKGFRRDDALVKIRVAARMFPWIKFYLIERPRGGDWKIALVPSS